MEVVQAILDSRSMGWKDTVRAIAYFKDIKDTVFFDNYCRKHGLLNLPVLVVQNDICRDDLLFEIEVDLIAVNKAGSEKVTPAHSG
ncbi:MAG: hypothetical protein NTY10_06580 [Candidatus Omnitrophica bacterium]|nr:hypothetical protein [Candidatus Omnitrophota bacterium]